MLGAFLKQGVENISVSVRCRIRAVPGLAITGRQHNTGDNESKPYHHGKRCQHGRCTGLGGDRMDRYYNDVRYGIDSLEPLHVNAIFRYRSDTVPAEQFTGETTSFQLTPGYSYGILERKTRSDCRTCQ